MFALFDTLEQYLKKLGECNGYRGYPDGRGTNAYAPNLPLRDVNGKYCMRIMPGVEHLFIGCATTDSIIIPEGQE